MSFPREEVAGAAQGSAGSSLAPVPGADGPSALPWRCSPGALRRDRGCSAALTVERQPGPSTVGAFGSAARHRAGQVPVTQQGLQTEAASSGSSPGHSGPGREAQ